MKIVTTLDRLEMGARATVLAIRGGFGMARNLRRMGVHPGDTVRVVGSGAFRGPILIEVHGCRLALGRGVARRIEVAPLGTLPRTGGGHGR